MRRSILALTLLAAPVSGPALAQPPADAKPLSEILATLEQSENVAWFDEIDWDDDDGYWEIEYHRQGGGSVEIEVDPVSGAIRR
jgi:hypothetical protein